MIRLCLFAVIALILLALPMTVYAEEPAQYNFASAQGSKELQVIPGGTCTGYIYFYNIDGNRITHITLEVIESPDGWQVTIDPPLGETTVIVNEVPVTVTENLYVEPSELFTEEPADVPVGMVSLSIPGRGYTLGKEARITVSVPDSAVIGASGKITIAGEAAWLGQGGSAAIQQARDFDFTVTVVSKSSEYTETIPGQGGDSNSGSGSAGFDLSKWLPVIIAAAIVVLGAVYVTLLVRKRRVR
jgi:hypothetical protein